MPRRRFPSRDVVIVTGTFDPIPLEEADRPVRAFDTRSLSLVTNTFADFLRLDSSLDLRQRAPNGLQGDLSIRGAGFGQTLVLLDGLRLNDVQSGHHNLDVPVPLEAVTRIEVLKGSGSTLYGSDAIGGVVNLITRSPDKTELRLRTGARELWNEPAAGRPVLCGAFVVRTADLFAGLFYRFHPESRLPESVACLAHVADHLGRPDGSHTSDERPAVRSGAVLRKLQLLGANQDLVCVCPTVHRPKNGSSVRVSSAYRPFRAVSRSAGGFHKSARCRQLSGGNPAHRGTRTKCEALLWR